MKTARELIRVASERFGGLDILVNNAGVGVFKPVDQLSVEDGHDDSDQPQRRPSTAAAKAIPLMREGGRRVYLRTSRSLAGVNPMPTGSAHQRLKFDEDLNGFSEAMMQDVRYDGIRVSYLMPGSVDYTDFARGPRVEVARIMEADGKDIAKAGGGPVQVPPTALRQPHRDATLTTTSEEIVRHRPRIARSSGCRGG